MMADHDEYKQFILTADPHALIKQLRKDVKTPLVSAQNTVHLLLMLQHPTAAIQQKIDSGELNVQDLLNQLGGLLMQAMDVVDFYRDTLDGA
jgi:antitoxin component HigA of HigAB toxin-antitoxin module